MNYDTLRHLADSWGLLVMFIMFLALIAYPFRPGGSRASKRAKNSIFDEDQSDG